MTDLKKIPSSQIERLRYIEFSLKFLGVFSRADLIERFGIGTAAASRDIAKYKELAPQNFDHSSNSRNFALNNNWKSLFEFESSEVLNQLTGRTLHTTNRIYISNDILDMIDSPNIELVAAISRAIFNKKAIEVDYFSKSSGLSTKIIVPHAFVYNGTRWHMRGYDRKRERFADFVISRFQAARSSDVDVYDNERQKQDDQWNRIVKLEIIPHPDFSNPEALANEFNMKNGVLEKRVRASSVGYYLQKLYVDCAKEATKGEHYFRLRLKNRLALYGVENLGLAPNFDGFEE